MACRVEIILAVEDGGFVPAAQTALDEIDRLEDTLSVFRATSTIAELNRRAAAEPVCVLRDVVDLLDECQALLCHDGRRLRSHVESAEPLLGLSAAGRVCTGC